MNLSIILLVTVIAKENILQLRITILFIKDLKPNYQQYTYHAQEHVLVGDICLEEAKDSFKFYIIDRIAKFEYEEFNNIEDAIQKLISYYRENKFVDDANKMEEILYQSLGLRNQKKETTNEEHPKILKPKKINQTAYISKLSLFI